MTADQHESPEFPEEAYLAHRRSLMELGIDQIKTYDRVLSGLSAGALGLSVMFVREIAGPGDVKGTDWLAAAWTAFGAALLLNLVSYLTSWSDTDREVDRIDVCLRERTEHPASRNWFRHVTVALNLSALGLFTTGVFCLARFAFLNLN